MSKSVLLTAILLSLCGCFSMSAMAQVGTLPAGGSVSGTISTSSQIDSYGLTLGADGQVSLVLTAQGGNLATITLYDANGTTVLGTLYTNSVNTLVVDGLAAGTYTVAVQETNAGQTVSYSVQETLTPAPGVADPEPNGSRGQADLLPLNGQQQGHINYYYNSKRDSADWFKVVTNKDGLLQLTLNDSSPENFYVNIYLYDFDGVTLLNSGTATTGGPLVINSDGLAAGTYFIKIVSYDPNQFEPYTLSDNLLLPPVPTDTEPNGTRNTALTLPVNDSVHGHIGYYYNGQRDSADWYKVTTAKDGLLQLTLNDLTPGNENYYSSIALYDQDGITQLNSGTATQGGPLVINTDGLAAGTYFVKITSYDPNQFEPYVLSDSLLLPAVPTDAEPNGTMATALSLPLNGGGTGHIGYYYAGQRDSADWYRLVTNKDGLIQLSLTDLSFGSENYYTNIYLYDHDGLTQLNSGTASNGSPFVINTDGLAAGTYYVKIVSYDPHQFEPYRLSDSLILPPVPTDAEPNGNVSQAILLPLNSALNGHIGYYYNQQRDTADWYTVTTNGNGLLKTTLTDLTPSNENYYVTYTLFDQDGVTSLNNGNSTPGNPSVLNSDGLAAGTYYLKVTAYDQGQFAPYTLSDTLYSKAAISDKEPNGTPAQADTLPLNGTASGTVGYYANHVRDSVDWFMLKTNADGMIRFTINDLSPNNENFYLSYAIYDRDGVTQLSNGTATTGGPTVQNVDGLAAGTYYIKITPYDQNQFAPYTVSDSLEQYNKNDPEPNNRPYQASRIPADSLVTGHLNFYYNGARDSADWWKIVYADTSGVLNMGINILPHLSDGSLNYMNFAIYQDTTASPIDSYTFSSFTNTINLTGLAKATYWMKVTYYNPNDFYAYNLTPYFNDNAYNATISLLTATPSHACSSDSLSYLLNNGGDLANSFSVVLYRNSTPFDSLVTSADTASFHYLPDGQYYASVTGLGAGKGQPNSSVVTTFAPVSPTPLPTDTPRIGQRGRLLTASLPAPRETCQWYVNDTLIQGAVDSIYTAADSGRYSVRFVNSCGSGPLATPVYFANGDQAQTLLFSAVRDTTYSPGLFIVLQASASSGLPVTFGPVSGPDSLHGDTLYITGTGSITVQALQAGNNTYGSATPVQVSFTVNSGAQSIRFQPVTLPVYSDSTITLHAGSTSGLPVIYTVISGPASIQDSVLTLSGAGPVIIGLSQPGNGQFNAAPDTQFHICVSAGQPGFIAGDTLVCTSHFAYAVDSVPGVVYQWTVSPGAAVNGSGSSGGTGGTGTGFSDTSVATVSSHGDSTDIRWKATGVFTVSVRAHSTCDTLWSKASTLTVTVTGAIAPGAVTQMTPANGTSGIGLPLSLSWTPGANTDTYDLYLWNIDSARPAQPLASGLDVVNYSPAPTDLLYGQTYRWQVVSRNACAQTGGPLQQFATMVLPDLAVSTVQAPANATSGQTISVSWKVSNKGPGNTTLNQHWTDAVFLSFDSTADFTLPPNTNPGGWSSLNFPVVPLLIGAVPNVSALDSGNSYTNTLSFSLPSNYSWPLYVYVITNYSPGASAPLESNKQNDTAHATAPIQVALAPSPDLRLDSVLTTGSVFSGNTVNVTYTVRNYGVLTNAGNNWDDKIYISQSPFFDLNTAVLLNEPKPNGTYYDGAPQAIVNHTGQLQTDSGYTQTVPVVIPNFIHGTYYIYVYTDADNNVYEGALENNNTNRSLVQVYLTPTPDLVVSSITVPSLSLSSTQPISLQWQIRNQGYYDNLQRDKGHYLDTVFCATCYQAPCSHIVNLCGGGSIGLPSNPCPVSQPGYTLSDSLGWGSSHWNDYVYISTDSTGINSKALLIGAFYHVQQITNGQIPDFDNSTSVPTFGSIQFGGQGSCEPTTVYPQKGLPLGANPRTYDVNTALAIQPGSVFGGSLQFQATDQLAQGKYYVYVYANADSGVYEYPSVQRILRASIPVSILNADLTVPTVSVPSTSSAGQSITVNYAVLNTGPGSIYNHYRRDNIYLSTSPVFDASAQLVSSQAFTENVPLNVPVSHQAVVLLPNGAAGTYYVYVYTNADSAFKEISRTNNIGGTAGSNGPAVTIKISQTVNPDLNVSAVTLPDTVHATVGFLLAYTVPNAGSGPTSGLWTDSVYVSCSPVWSAGSVYPVGITTHSTVIAAGGSYSDSIQVQLPLTFLLNSCFAKPNSVVYFFVKTNGGEGILETNYANDLGVSHAVEVINPLVDQVVTAITGADTAAVGRNYLLTWTVQNNGVNPGPAYYSHWVDNVYFSPDSVFDSQAVLAGNDAENQPLAGGSSYSASAQVVVPLLTAGRYYVFVQTNAGNNIPAELQLSNNISVMRNGAGQSETVNITVPPLPDLVDSIVSVQTSVAIGQPLPITYQVSNIGVGTTYPANWSDDLWLSQDYIPGNQGDIHIGSVNHSGALVPGAYYLDTLLPTIGMDVPPGNYILIVKTNTGGGMFESNTANNLAFRYVNVFSPAPTDLTVTHIIHPDTVLLGTAMPVQWTIANISANTASGTETDGIYLSSDTTVDSTAVLQGVSVNSLNILPLNGYAASAAPLLQGVPEGDYNLLVKTDILDNIVESNKLNNTGMAARKVHVSVKQLPMQVLLSDTLQSLTRYYKLVIPDSLQGATILFTLKTNDSLSASNQVYMGLGYIPTAAHYDLAFGTPNAGNQQILMPSVSDSVYYISIVCVTPPPPTQLITLQALNLPFAILNVNASQGGNTGNVTVQINGSLFSNAMQASLSTSDTGKHIYATGVYYVNSTTVYATFNLRGVALGTYDVHLMKSDSTIATLARSFSVVAANNGGLITGTGVNSGQSGSGNQPGCDPGDPSGLNAQLQTKIVLPPNVFAGWPFVIQINYANPSNVDIPVQTRILYSTNGLPVSLTQDGLSTGATSLYIQFAEQNGPPGIMRAGASGTLYIYSKAPVGYPAHTKAFFNLK